MENEKFCNIFLFSYFILHTFCKCLQPFSRLFLVYVFLAEFFHCNVEEYAANRESIQTANNGIQNILIVNLAQNVVRFIEKIFEWFGKLVQNYDED